MDHRQSSNVVLSRCNNSMSLSHELVVRQNLESKTSLNDDIVWLKSDSEVLAILSSDNQAAIVFWIWNWNFLAILYLEKSVFVENSRVSNVVVPVDCRRVRSWLFLDWNLDESELLRFAPVKSLLESLLADLTLFVLDVLINDGHEEFSDLHAVISQS